MSPIGERKHKNKQMIDVESMEINLKTHKIFRKRNLKNHKVSFEGHKIMYRQKLRDIITSI